MKVYRQNSDGTLTEGEISISYTMTEALQEARKMFDAANKAELHLMRNIANSLVTYFDELAEERNR